MRDLEFLRELFSSHYKPMEYGLALRLNKKNSFCCANKIILSYVVEGGRMDC